MYIRELSVQYRLRPLSGDVIPMTPLRSPSDAAALLVRLVGPEVVEVCIVLCLSTQWDVLAFHELSRRTVDATMVQPRDVFRTALLANARAIIVGHNHPSGQVTPSAADAALTARLSRAGDLIGIPLIDHLVVSTEGRFYSFREAGLITLQPPQGETACLSSNPVSSKFVCS